MLKEKYQNVNTEKCDKILGLHIAMDSSKVRMIKERTLKANQAWSLGKSFYLNTNIDKKIRMKCFDATIRTILQYGLATQNRNELPSIHSFKVRKKNRRTRNVARCKN